MNVRNEVKVVSIEMKIDILLILIVPFVPVLSSVSNMRILVLMFSYEAKDPLPGGSRKTIIGW